MYVVIAFDISCDRSRRRVVKLLEGHGLRVQYSLFECMLNKRQYRQLQKQIQRNIKDTDRVAYYPLCNKDLAGRRAEGEGEVIWVNHYYLSN